MNSKCFTKDFTLVVIGQVISLFGNAILRFALPLYLLRETQSPALFGIVTACSFLPMIVLSFLGGILADRVNKRSIMVILDFSTAAVILLFFLALGKLPIVPLFVVTLMLLYGISGTYQPTVQASIPALVTGENVLTAGAVVNQIGSLAGLLGPIVGGMLFGAFGLVPILLISTLCFIGSAVMELFIHIPFVKRDNRIGVGAIIKSDFHDCVHYLKGEKPGLMRIMWIVALFNLVISPILIVGVPVLIIDTLKMSDALLGFAQGALALGGLCGGILTAVLGQKLRVKRAHYLLMFCALSIGGMAAPLLLPLSGTANYLIILAVSFVVMALATMFTVQMLATVQTQTPPELVGKIIAFMMALSMSAQPVGQAVYGVVFDRFAQSLGTILLAVALISSVASLAFGKFFRALDF